MDVCSRVLQRELSVMPDVWEATVVHSESGEICPPPNNCMFHTLGPNIIKKLKKKDDNKINITKSYQIIPYLSQVYPRILSFYCNQDAFSLHLIHKVNVAFSKTVI